MRKLQIAIPAAMDEETMEMPDPDDSIREGFSLDLYAKYHGVYV